MPIREGIDVGTKKMAAHPRGGLNSQHVFGRKTLARLEPLPCAGLSDIADSREGGLRPSYFTCALQRFKGGDPVGHGLYL